MRLKCIIFPYEWGCRWTPSLLNMTNFTQLLFFFFLFFLWVSALHKQLSSNIKQKPESPQQLQSSRKQLPWLSAWIGLSEQTWRSSTGPQAAIIRLAAADNCHQTKQDREILPLSVQLFPFLLIFTSSSQQHFCSYSYCRRKRCTSFNLIFKWHHCIRTVLDKILMRKCRHLKESSYGRNFVSSGSNLVLCRKKFATVRMSR